MISPAPVPTRSSRLALTLDLVRLVLFAFAFVTLTLWGFLGFALPLPGVLIGVGAPVLAIILWALFLSPRAVLRVDDFGRALVEIAIFTSAAVAWWLLGHPAVAIPTAVIAATTGIAHGLVQMRPR